jgi:hypothetical protein
MNLLPVISSPFNISPFTTFDPLNTSTYLTLSNGNLTASTNQVNQTDNSTISAVGKSSGKWYCELTVTAHIGGFSGDYEIVGISKTFPADNVAIGSVAGQVGYISVNGHLLIANVGSAYANVYVLSDVVSVVLDMNAGTLRYWVNGIDQGQAATGLTGTYFIAVDCLAGTLITAITANFGTSAWAYAPPAGFIGWTR